MIRIAEVGEIRRGEFKVFRILARPVGVFREMDGSFRAIEVACRHENADLTQGKIVGDVVTCPWHGWRYNLRTGECLWGGPTPLRPYACEVREGSIYISMLPIEEGPGAVKQLGAEDAMGSW